MEQTDDGPAPDRPADVWQRPDAAAAQHRVTELQRSAAALRESLRRTADVTEEIEAIHDALALARIDVEAHRAQRRALDRELEERRSASVVRQRREVVELFEATERRLLAASIPRDDDITRRLDAVRYDLEVARRELEEANAERRAWLDAALGE